MACVLSEALRAPPESSNGCPPVDSGLSPPLIFFGGELVRVGVDDARPVRHSVEVMFLPMNGGIISTVD